MSMRAARLALNNIASSPRCRVLAAARRCVRAASVSFRIFIKVVARQEFIAYSHARSAAEVAFIESIWSMSISPSGADAIVSARWSEPMMAAMRRAWRTSIGLYRLSRKAARGSLYFRAEAVNYLDFILLLPDGILVRYRVICPGHRGA